MTSTLIFDVLMLAELLTVRNTKPMTNPSEAYEILSWGHARPVHLPNNNFIKLMHPDTTVQIPTEHNDFSAEAELPLEISLKSCIVGSGQFFLEGISANVPFPHAIHIEQKPGQATGEIRLEQVLPKTLREAHQTFMNCAVPYELFPDAPVTYHEDTGLYAGPSATTVKLADGREIKISDANWGDMSFSQPSKNLDTTEHTTISSIDSIPKIRKAILTPDVGIVSWDCSEDSDGVEAVKSAIALLKEAAQTAPSKQAEYASLVALDMHALYGEQAVWDYYAKRAAEESAKRAQHTRQPVICRDEDIPF